MMEIKNAEISSVSLSNGDHGCLSAWLHLDYGGSGQGFGGWNLYSPKSHKDDKTGNYAGHFIWRCLEVAGVTEWKDLVGKTIRVKCTHDKVQAIGHILKDLWFCPSDEFKEL